MIFNEMDGENKFLMSKSELIPWLKDHQPEVLVTIGAGDIDTLVPEVRQFLNEQNHEAII
jgi:UDP-N-acetylmuramate--alanine ligase